MIDLAIRLSRGADFQLGMETRLPTDRITGVYGPSGSGKTSLLYCIAGLLPADPGSTVTVGQDKLQAGDTCLPAHQRDIACVFQDGRLFPHLSVAGNIDYAWKRRCRDGPTPTELRDWLELGELWERRPAELSRGQQQRVAIARGLASSPRLLLLDEPLANIDRRGRRDLLCRLGNLHRQLDLPMIYVSHDMAELAELAEHLLVISEGRIAAEGPLLELSTRIELALSHEEQAAAIVSATIESHNEGYGLTELALDGQRMFVGKLAESPGTAIRLRLPARDISLCRTRPEQTSILNILEGTITDIEAGQASRVLVRIQVGTQFMLARVTRKSIDELSLSAGERVYAQVKSVALLSDTGGASSRE
jgi:molybdate transport system ATP-binding protein